MLGYLPAYIVQCHGSMAVLFMHEQFPNFVFASYWLLSFIAENITMDLAAFNADGNLSNANRRGWIRRFCDLVQTYSDAKQ